jgi:hypothetical protein
MALFLHSSSSPNQDQGELAMKTRKSLVMGLAGFFLFSMAGLCLATPDLETFDLTVNYYPTASWVGNSSMQFNLFESSSDLWPCPTSSIPASNASASWGALAPGTVNLGFSTVIQNPSNLYMVLQGTSTVSPTAPPNESGWMSAWSAQPSMSPSTGNWFNNATEYEYGAGGWISLANLQTTGGMSGVLEIFYGNDSTTQPQDPGSDDWIVGTWSISETPEPASILLVSSLLGIAGVRKMFKVGGGTA